MGVFIFVFTDDSINVLNDFPHHMYGWELIFFNRSYMRTETVRLLPFLLPLRNCPKLSVYYWSKKIQPPG